MKVATSAACSSIRHFVQPWIFCRFAESVLWRAPFQSSARCASSWGWMMQRQLQRCTRPCVHTINRCVATTSPSRTPKLPAIPPVSTAPYASTPSFQVACYCRRPCEHKRYLSCLDFNKTLHHVCRNLYDYNQSCMFFREDSEGSLSTVGLLWCKRPERLHGQQGAWKNLGSVCHIHVLHNMR